MKDELATFSPGGRRRIFGYVGLSFLAALVVYGGGDDFAPASDRIVQLRGLQYLTCALSFHLGFGAGAVALVAAQRRAWRIALLAAAVALAAVGPEIPLARLFAAAPALSGRAVSVMSVNVLMINKDVDPICAEIAAAAPDVLVIQEYSTPWDEALSKRMTGYAYSGRVRDDSFGAAIYSKIPFKEEPRLDVRLGSWNLPQMRAVLDVGAKGLALYNLHLAPPRNTDYTAEHRAMVRDLVAVLKQEALPMIVAGDFNLTPRMPQFTALTEVGLIDAHQLAYRGRHSTWPVIGFMRYLPGVALDHIFVSPQIPVLAAGIGTGQGSDHRPLTVTVDVR